MNGELDARAAAKAGLYTGVVLYTLCLIFFLVVYGGEADWMIQPFMPGVTTSPAGYLLGLVWSAAYGAGIVWILVFFYNREVQSS